MCVGAVHVVAANPCPLDLATHLCFVVVIRHLQHLTLHLERKILIGTSQLLFSMSELAIFSFGTSPVIKVHAESSFVFCVNRGSCAAA